jgi:hypothetical protein
MFIARLLCPMAIRNLTLVTRPSTSTQLMMKQRALRRFKGTDPFAPIESEARARTLQPRFGNAEQLSGLAQIPRTCALSRRVHTGIDLRRLIRQCKHLERLRAQGNLIGCVGLRRAPSAPETN